MCVCVWVGVGGCGWVGVCIAPAHKGQWPVARPSQCTVRRVYNMREQLSPGYQSVRGPAAALWAGLFFIQGCSLTKHLFQVI